MSSFEQQTADVVDENAQDDELESEQEFEVENELPDDEEKIRKEMANFVVYDDDPDEDDNEDDCDIKDKALTDENEAEMLRREFPYDEELLRDEYTEGPRRSKRRRTATKFFEEEFAEDMVNVLLEGQSYHDSESDDDEYEMEDEDEEFEDSKAKKKSACEDEEEDEEDDEEDDDDEDDEDGDEDDDGDKEEEGEEEDESDDDDNDDGNCEQNK